jgi:hypothetical protein
MKKLNARQTQRLLLAGTVGFPKPFPTIGSISIEKSKLIYSSNCAEGATFVVVQERHKDGITRLILRQGVSAIFIPGTWVRLPKKKARVFRFSRRHAVHNFERGEWFLGPEISAKAIRTRLEMPTLRIDRRRNSARGIVFVQKDHPVLTITEKVQLAGCVESYKTNQAGCDCDYGCPPGCDPDHAFGLGCPPGCDPDHEPMPD